MTKKDITLRLRGTGTALAREAADTIMRLRAQVLEQKERADQAEKRALGASFIVRSEGGRGHGEP